MTDPAFLTAVDQLTGSYEMAVLGVILILGGVWFLIHNILGISMIGDIRQFGLLYTIGTTKKQIRKILTLEGGIYALISTLLIMTFGNAFLMLVADAVPHMANYAVFKYPVALVIGLIAAIFVICLSVPAIVYKATSDETVIERLHNFDS